MKLSITMPVYNEGPRILNNIEKAVQTIDDPEMDSEHIKAGCDDWDQGGVPARRPLENYLQIAC